jgi:streptogramin lyase
MIRLPPGSSLLVLLAALERCPRTIGRVRRGLSMIARPLILGLTLVPAAACSSDDEADPVEAPTAAEAVLTVDDLLVARLTLPGDPDWLAVDEHGIWVQRASGELTLIDPTTNEVAGSVNVGTTDLCSGLGASYGAIWTCVGPDVARVDPETFEVVAQLAVKKQAVQGHLVGGFDRVWVLTSDGSSLIGIDPATNEVATEFELPARCTDVSLAKDALWLPCNVDDRVLKVDPISGDVLLDLAVDNPLSVAVDTDVWVGTATTTVQLDPATGKVLLEADAGAAPDGGVALDADSVWVRNGTDFLVRLDRESGQRVQQVTAADLTSGGDLLVLDDEIWTTAYDDQYLFRIDPSAD